MDRAIVLVNIIMEELNFGKYYELAEYLGVTAPAISGWINRNSVKTILKHAARKGIDINSLQAKLDELTLQQNNETEKVEEEECPLLTPEQTHKAYQKVQREKELADIYVQAKRENVESKEQRRASLRYAEDKPFGSSPFSLLFQILVGENKDVIFEILNKRLHEEKELHVEDKIAFIEDFELLMQHTVSAAAKLKMLERLSKKPK